MVAHGDSRVRGPGRGLCLDPSARGWPSVRQQDAWFRSYWVRQEPQRVRGQLWKAPRWKAEVSPQLPDLGIWFTFPRLSTPTTPPDSFPFSNNSGLCTPCTPWSPASNLQPAYQAQHRGDAGWSLCYWGGR